MDLIEDAGFFHDQLMPFLGEDTYLLYAPVCRGWSKAYTAKVTNPRHLFADLDTFTRHKEDMWDCVTLFAARYATDPAILELFERGDVELAIEAIKYGNVASYEWFILDIYCSSIVPTAAEYGRLEILKLLEIDDDYERVLEAAGKSGSIEVIDYILHTDELLEEEDLIDIMLIAAAAAGHLHVVEYARDEGLEWRRPEVAAAAIEGGHQWLFEWLVREGCGFSIDECMKAAARGGHLGTLIWLRDVHAGRLTEAVINAAAIAGHRGIVQWLRAEGCPWSAATLEGSVESGDYLLVKWMLDNGCPMNEDCCIAAVRWSSPYRTDIVGLLRAEGCPWSDRTAIAAIGNNATRFLKWALDRSIPLTIDVMKETLKRYNWPKYVGWLSRHGCPIDGSVYDVLPNCHRDRTVAAAFITKKIRESGIEPRFGSMDLFMRLADVCGGLEQIKYLHSIGHPFDHDALVELCLHPPANASRTLLKNRRPILRWYVDEVMADPE